MWGCPVQCKPGESVLSSSPPGGHLLSNPGLCTAWKNGMNTHSTLCFVFMTKQWFIRYQQSITELYIQHEPFYWEQTHMHRLIHTYTLTPTFPSTTSVSGKKWSPFSSSYQNLCSCAPFGNMEPQPSKGNSTHFWSPEVSFIWLITKSQTWVTTAPGKPQQLQLRNRVGGNQGGGPPSTPTSAQPPLLRGADTYLPGQLQEELSASTWFLMQTDRHLENLSQATTLKLNLRPKKIVHSDTRAGTNSHTSIDITNEPRKHREREGVYFLLFVYLLNLSQVWIANSNWLPRNKNNCYF